MSRLASGGDYRTGRVDTSCSIQSRNIAGSSDECEQRRASNVITTTHTHTGKLARRGHEALIMGWPPTGGAADGTDCDWGEKYCQVLPQWKSSEAEREEVKRRFLKKVALDLEPNMSSSSSTTTTIVIFNHVFASLRF